MRAFIAALAIAAATAALVTASASAATQEISIVGCYYNNGGSMTVPAGTEVVFRAGWAGKNRGDVQQFLKAQTTTADLNGTPISNASNLWGPIQKTDKKFYVSFWRSSAGTLANPGDSTTIHYQTTLDRTVSDTDENGKHTKVGPGPIFPADFHCTVTAT